MIVTKPALCRNHDRLVKQVLTVILQHRPFDAAKTHLRWTPDAVSDILRSIPRLLFQSPRSIGRQNNLRRHRTPLRQRKLNDESEKLRSNTLVLGPAAHRDPEKVRLGLEKAAEFFSWVEGSFGFSHNEATTREMALVLARGNSLRRLWSFLKEMSRREPPVITTPTVTCLMKVLAEEGLVNEALTAFHQMRRLRCRPDTVAHNAAVQALCHVGLLERARQLVKRMELPGFESPPDCVTYTILVTAFCRHAVLAGPRKATRHRLWAANYLFRTMLFRGLTPDTVAYNALIDGLCKTARIDRALELLNEMPRPNRTTYDSFVRYYSAVNQAKKAMEMVKRMREAGHGSPSASTYTPIVHSLCRGGKGAEALAVLDEMVRGGFVPREYTYRLVRECSGELDEGLRRRIESGIKERFDRVSRFKPVMTRRGYDDHDLVFNTD